MRSTSAPKPSGMSTPTTSALDRIRRNNASLMQRLKEAPVPQLLSKENVMPAFGVPSSLLGAAAKVLSDEAGTGEDDGEVSGSDGSSVSISDDEVIEARVTARRRRHRGRGRRRHKRSGDHRLDDSSGFDGGVVDVERPTTARSSALVLAERVTATGFDSIYSSDGDDRSDAGSEHGGAPRESAMLQRYSASRDREAVRRLERERDEALQREERLRRDNGELESARDEVRGEARQHAEREQAVVQRAQEAQLAFAAERMELQAREFAQREERARVETALESAKAESVRALQASVDAKSVLESEQQRRAALERKATDLRVELSRVSAERDATQEQESTLTVRVEHATTEARALRERVEMLSQRVVKEEGLREQYEAAAARLEELRAQDALEQRALAERHAAEADAKAREVADRAEALATLQAEHTTLLSKYRPLSNEHAALTQQVEAQAREAEAHLAAQHTRSDAMRAEVDRELASTRKRVEEEAEVALEKMRLRLETARTQNVEDAREKVQLEHAVELSDVNVKQLTIERDQSRQHVALLQSRIEEVETQLSDASAARASARDDARRFREACGVLEQQRDERATAVTESVAAVAATHAREVVGVERERDAALGREELLKAQTTTLAEKMGEKEAALSHAVNDAMAQKQRADELSVALERECAAHGTARESHVAREAEHTRAVYAKLQLCALLASFASEGAALAAEEAAHAAEQSCADFHESTVRTETIATQTVEDALLEEATAKISKLTEQLVAQQKKNHDAKVEADAIFRSRAAQTAAAFERREMAWSAKQSGGQELASAKAERDRLRARVEEMIVDRDAELLLLNTEHKKMMEREMERMEHKSTSAQHDAMLEVSQAERQRANVAEQLAAAVADKKDMAQRLESVTRDLKDMQEEVVSVKKRCEAGKQKVLAKQSDIDALVHAADASMVAKRHFELENAATIASFVASLAHHAADMATLEAEMRVETAVAHAHLDPTDAFSVKIQKLQQERNALEAELKGAQNIAKAKLDAMRSAFAEQLKIREDAHKETKEAHVASRESRSALEDEIEALHKRLEEESELHAATHEKHAEVHDEIHKTHAEVVQGVQDEHSALVSENEDLHRDAEELHAEKCELEAAMELLRAQNAELHRQVEMSFMLHDDHTSEHSEHLEQMVFELQGKLAVAQLEGRATHDRSAPSTDQLAQRWEQVLSADTTGARTATVGGEGEGNEEVVSAEIHASVLPTELALLRGEKDRLEQQLDAIERLHTMHLKSAKDKHMRAVLMNVLLKQKMRKLNAACMLMRWQRQGNTAQSAQRAIQIVRTHRDETRRNLRSLALARWTTGAQRWKTWVLKSALHKLQRHTSNKLGIELVKERAESAVHKLNSETLETELKEKDKRVSALQGVLKKELIRNDADAEVARHSLAQIKGLELKCMAAEKRTTAAVLKLGRLRAQVGEYDSDSDSSDDEG